MSPIPLQLKHCKLIKSLNNTGALKTTLKRVFVKRWYELQLDSGLLHLVAYRL